MLSREHFYSLVYIPYLMIRCSYMSADLLFWLFYRGLLRLTAWCRCSASMKTLWRPLDVCSWLVYFGGGMLSSRHYSMSVLFFMYNRIFAKCIFTCRCRHFNCKNTDMHMYILNWIRGKSIVRILHRWARGHKYSWNILTTLWTAHRLL